MENYPPVTPITQVVQRRRSFLSTMALGLFALLITLTVSAAAVVLYGMNIADRKTDNLAGFIEQAVRTLPEIQKSLPPVLADVLRDERRPDYRSRIIVSGKLVSTPEAGGGLQPVVEVQNQGNEVVNLLFLDVTALDERPLDSWTFWGATPFNADRDWPGPLMPGAKRRLPSRQLRIWPDRLPVNARLEVEISDIRIWKEPGGKTQELGRAY